ncbi:group III truncated hemoglobin [Sphingobium sp. CFD-2]|uniref:group III truncated hemoglobin n=1 Tax=Sphingobium sp. CFD-2 TaxID=2878542 RepID=UPI00214C2CD8|nr:group III truncated hemoglobin [Sphingobium sp. CFD-2]
MNGVSSVSESDLERVVEAFYARVREDDRLGPIFNDAVQDWPEHLSRLTDFWSSVMLGSGRYKGQPVVAHLKHKSRLSPELFKRWLLLWNQTTGDLVAADAAAALQAKAAQIAESLQLAIFFRLPRHPMSCPAMDKDQQNGPAHHG